MKSRTLAAQALPYFHHAPVDGMAVICMYTRQGASMDISSLLTASSEPDVFPEHYKQILDYERHFNSLESGLRQLASVWLLAALSAIAFLVRQNLTEALVDAKLLVAIVALMGNTGLMVLWILDQLVYHRLLNAVYLLGLRMEFMAPNLPPIRTLMMLYSRKRGMARFQRLFYLAPMFGLGLISLGAGMWQVGANDAHRIVYLIGVAAVAMPGWVVWKSTRLESYEEIAEGFGDPAFVRFLKEKSFESVLRRSCVGGATTEISNENRRF